ncbi:uncharacterized protein LOC127588489 [Hippocampus zosterae]|uniref:uncharacterized protein LOC127588489 n=1 Tax=Hippocampus zosterae TaxID=109293 RepID=UPI00223CC451|nr:uncharacterized protein LOC127588489 [Hippocampus zosterae]
MASRTGSRNTSLVPTKALCSFNNNKPWFTPKLRQLGKEKEGAFRSGDRAVYKHAENQLTKELNIAKRSYAERLEKHSLLTTASVWNGLKAITNYRLPCPQTVNNKGLGDELNMFFCRFEKDTAISHIHPSLPETTLSTPPPSFSPIQIHEQDVKQQKIKKAAGPDKVSTSCLKVCADQLAPVFTQIFNRSLELCDVPSCFKQSTIIPVPKKPATSELNDSRPVALMSVAMKSFERLVLNHLKNVTGPLLDPLQFAYRAKRSVEDAVNKGLHYILEHLNSTGTYARILLVDIALCSTPSSRNSSPPNFSSSVCPLRSASGSSAS